MGYTIFGDALWSSRTVQLALPVPELHRLLALLLLRRNTIVAHVEVEELVWNSRLLPFDVLQGHLDWIAREAGSPRPLIRYEQGRGWWLHAPPGSVDVDLAANLVDHARACVAAGDHETARAAYGRALDILRGTPFDTLDGEPFETERRRLLAWRDAVHGEFAQLSASAPVGASLPPGGGPPSTVGPPGPGPGPGRSLQERAADALWGDLTRRVRFAGSLVGSSVVRRPRRVFVYPPLFAPWWRVVRTPGGWGAGLLLVIATLLPFGAAPVFGLLAAGGRLAGRLHLTVAAAVYLLGELPATQAALPATVSEALRLVPGLHLAVLLLLPCGRPAPPDGRHPVRVISAKLGSALPAVMERLRRDEGRVVHAPRFPRGRLRTLSAEVDAEPLREDLWEAYLTALVDAGRTADALAEYDRMTHVLRQWLGTPPGPALQMLRRRITADASV